MTKKTRQTVALDPYPVILRVKKTKRPLKDAIALTSLMSDGEVVTTFDIRHTKKELHSAAIHESVHVCQFVQDYV